MPVVKTAGESACLRFSSPDSDREQTTEGNEKQICGGEEEEGNKNKEKVGHPGVGRGGKRKEEWGKEKKEREKGRRGEEKVTAKKGGLSSTSPQETGLLMFPT